MPLVYPFVDHEHTRELRTINDILDHIPEAGALVIADLVARGLDGRTGRPGLSGDRLLVEEARVQEVERKQAVRIDWTVMESNIHHPTNRSLLWDSVRVLARWMGRCPARSVFTDCVIEDGNPADSGLAVGMIERKPYSMVALLLRQPLMGASHRGRTCRT